MIEMSDGNVGWALMGEQDEGFDGEGNSESSGWPDFQWLVKTLLKRLRRGLGRLEMMTIIQWIRQNMPATEESTEET